MLSIWLRFIIGYGFIVHDAFAESESGLGLLANQALGPVSIMYNVIGTTSFAIGILFVLASIIRYIDYRNNPLRTTISTVIFLLISGIILVTLPFLSSWTGQGPHFFMLDFFGSDN